MLAFLNKYRKTSEIEFILKSLKNTNSQVQY